MVQLFRQGLNGQPLNWRGLFWKHKTILFWPKPENRKIFNLLNISVFRLKNFCNYFLDFLRQWFTGQRFKGAGLLKAKRRYCSFRTDSAKPAESAGNFNLSLYSTSFFSVSIGLTSSMKSWLSSFFFWKTETLKKPRFSSFRFLNLENAEHCCSIWYNSKINFIFSLTLSASVFLQSTPF